MNRAEKDHIFWEVVGSQDIEESLALNRSSLSQSCQFWLNLLTNFVRRTMVLDGLQPLGTSTTRRNSKNYFRMPKQQASTHGHQEN
jgi:hypothetical protein